SRELYNPCGFGNPNPVGTSILTARTEAFDNAHTPAEARSKASRAALPRSDSLLYVARSFIMKAPPAGWLKVRSGFLPVCRNDLWGDCIGSTGSQGQRKIFLNPPKAFETTADINLECELYGCLGNVPPQGRTLRQTS